MPAGTPLSGLRVVECATYVAGPFSGMTLAQLGAEVIRIDPIGGATDYQRWPVAPSGRSLYWTSLNKAKRSFAVDMRSPEGQELMISLITQPGPDRGVFVDNTINRPWLSYETLSARRADLIHVHVQGHPDGRPAVDYTVNASLGIPDITGPEQVGTPVNHVLPAWDLLTGSGVVVGVLGALLARQRDGSGAYIELALADVALAGVAALGWVGEAQLSERPRPRHGNHVYGSFGVDFAAHDGHRVMVVALTEGQWRALRKVTGTAEVFAALEKALDVDLERENDRYVLRETIAAILRPWFEARSFADVTTALDSAHVLWGPYETLREHVYGDSPALLQDIDQPDIGKVLSASSPLRWSGAYGTVKTAPQLGADTESILGEDLGLSEAEIGRLLDANVVAIG